LFAPRIHLVHFDRPICLETDAVLSLVFLLSAASRCSLVRVGRGDEASPSQTLDFVFVVVFLFSNLFPSSSSSLPPFHASGINLELPSRTRCLAIILLIILRLTRRDPRCLCPFSPLPDFSFARIWTVFELIWIPQTAEIRLISDCPRAR